jgi:hypothetical protein
MSKFDFQLADFDGVPTSAYRICDPASEWRDEKGKATLHCHRCQQLLTIIHTKGFRRAVAVKCDHHRSPIQQVARYKTFKRCRMP